MFHSTPPCCSSFVFEILQLFNKHSLITTCSLLPGKNTLFFLCSSFDSSTLGNVVYGNTAYVATVVANTSVTEQTCFTLPQYLYSMLCVQQIFNNSTSCYSTNTLIILPSLEYIFCAPYASFRGNPKPCVRIQKWSELSV